jgi:recombination protein RecR
MNFSSKLLEEAVQAFASLPGIGRKTALRLALHLLNKEPAFTERIVSALQRMRQGIRSCQQCHNLADEQLCAVCADRSRDRSIICVVESIRDVMAIEDTHQYRGLYHVLGGVISPIEGVGPEQLHIEDLVGRASSGEVTELIMALSPTIEGDTTIFYISRKLRSLPLKISAIARGVAFGGELEYADELTLGRSIIARVPYAGTTDEM